MNDFHFGFVLNGVVYATLGILLLVALFVIWDRLTPYSFWRKVAEEKNLAVAVLMGAVFLGFCWIIAAALH
jgi:uncharacterized membrane protein YjfL (UPF0719 family)